MVRKVLAFIAGGVAGFVMVALVEGISSLVYPRPSGLDWTDREAVLAFINSLPMGAFLFVLVAHVAGSFTAGAVSSLVAGHKWIAGAIALAVFLLVGAILNLILIPHPLWFGILDVLVYIPCAILGAYVAGMILGGGGSAIHKAATA